MVQQKDDPRVIRTRKLIMDAFIHLSETKEFKDITVKDITVDAQINRATFYYHFQDIYDLLEKSLHEVLSVQLPEPSEWNSDAILSLFAAITDFQQTLSTRCHRGYEDTIARIIRDQVEVVSARAIAKSSASLTNEATMLLATMASWSLYGASVEWKRRMHLSPEEFIKPVLPQLVAMIWTPVQTGE